MIFNGVVNNTGGNT